MDHIPNLPLHIVEKFIYAISRKRNVVQSAGAEIRSVRHTWPDRWESMLNITDDIQVLWYLKDPNESKSFKEAGAKRRGAPMPTGFSLTAMALKYLKLETPDLSDFFKKGHKFRELDEETARLYGCADVDVTLRLYLNGIDPAMRDSFIYKLETQLIEVLTDMEEIGILFDKTRLSDIELSVRDVVVEARIDAYKGLRCDLEAVNIDSPTQLARHLYNTLQWPIIGKKRKDGLGSTDKTVMSRFAESANADWAEAATKYLEYKRWFTLHNNFLTKLDQYVNPVTNAIHCSFLATVVPTGRLACASPNLQQIPQKRKDGKAPVRSAFRARPGKYLMEADHSQVELRVYAGETQEGYYFNSFANDEDLHLKTASVIFRELITDKGDPRRQMGKTMNFGPIYGMKPEGLAYRTDYTLQEAERILDDFFSVMPDAVQWTREVHQRAKQQGGVHTHFGRWRPLPWLHSRIPHEVEFGERSAVNTIVQGTAADIMKIGLVRLWKELKKPECQYHKLATMLLTVHDSVLLEIDESVDPVKFFEFLETMLCFPIKGYPPLSLDATIGRDWHYMTDLKIDVPVPVADKPMAEMQKTVALPFLNEEQQAKFLSLVKQSSTGEVQVTFRKPDGTDMTSKTISLSTQSYQQVLMFLVGVARDHQNGTVEAAADVPRVVFA